MENKIKEVLETTCLLIRYNYIELSKDMVKEVNNAIIDVTNIDGYLVHSIV